MRFHIYEVSMKLIETQIEKKSMCMRNTAIRQHNQNHIWILCVESLCIYSNSRWKAVFIRISSNRFTVKLHFESYTHISCGGFVFEGKKDTYTFAYNSQSYFTQWYRDVSRFVWIIWIIPVVIIQRAPTKAKKECPRHDNSANCESPIRHTYNHSVKMIK